MIDTDRVTAVLIFATFETLLALLLLSPSTFLPVGPGRGKNRISFKDACEIAFCFKTKESVVYKKWIHRCEDLVKFVSAARLRIQRAGIRAGFVFIIDVPPVFTCIHLDPTADTNWKYNFILQIFMFKSIVLA